jgi:hypothetical protein
MKQLPKKEGDEVSGGIGSFPVPQPIMPLPQKYPTDPCIPGIPDPLAEFKK